MALWRVGRKLAKEPPLISKTVVEGTHHPSRIKHNGCWYGHNAELGYKLTMIICSQGHDLGCCA